MKKVVLGFIAALILTPSAYAAGWLYENTTEVLVPESAEKASKVGSATCKNVLNIVQWGNCGIYDAMLNGKLNEAEYFDTNRRGTIFYRKITTRAYGK